MNPHKNWSVVSKSLDSSVAMATVFNDYHHPFLDLFFFTIDQSWIVKSSNLWKSCTRPQFLLCLPSERGELGGVRTYARWLGEANGRSQHRAQRDAGLQLAAVRQLGRQQGERACSVATQKPFSAACKGKFVLLFYKQSDFFPWFCWTLEPVILQVSYM